MTQQNEEIKNEQQTQIDERKPTDESLNTEVQNVDAKIPYDRFKAKVDEANALKEELAKLREAQEAAEREKLEKQNEYKALYEKAQADLEAIKADALNAKKDALLAQAGYTSEQVERYRKFISGETDEELTRAIDELKADIPPKQYADPSPMNGVKDEPKPVDKSEIGAKVFERIKNKIF